MIEESKSKAVDIEAREVTAQITFDRDIPHRGGRIVIDERSSSWFERGTMLALLRNDYFTLGGIDTRTQPADLLRAFGINQQRAVKLEPGTGIGRVISADR